MQFLSVLSLFITYFVLVSSTESEEFEIRPLNEFQGLFENVGNLKLIVKWKTLQLNLNLTSFIDETQNELEVKMEKIKSLCVDAKEHCENKLQHLTDSFKAKKRELDDLLGLKRKKRGLLEDFFGVMTDEHGEKISEDLQRLYMDVKFHREYLKFVQGIIGNLMNFSFDSVISLVNATNVEKDELRKTKVLSLITDLMLTKTELERKLNAIFGIMINKRMDTSVISVQELEDKLKEMCDELEGTNQSFPFKSIRELLTSIETDYEIEGKIMTFKIEIPFVEDSPWQLYEIHSSPFRWKNDVLMLTPSSSFLASDGNHVTTFVSLKTCYKSNESPPTYFCELQSPMHSVESSDCLTKTFVTKKVEIDACANMIQDFEYDQLTFIINGNNEYFFFTKRPESIEIYCKGKSYIENLSELMGVIKLNRGCSISSKYVKLLAMDRSQKSVINKVLEIGLDTADFDEKVNSIENIKYLENPINRIDELRQDFERARSIKFDKRIDGEWGLSEYTIASTAVCGVLALLSIFMCIVLYIKTRYSRLNELSRSTSAESI